VARGARIELGQTYAEIAAAMGKPTPEAARMAVKRIGSISGVGLT
jgi:O6-methylguanine-DNA--protein-cysteine methyltransferase